MTPCITKMVQLFRTERTERPNCPKTEHLGMGDNFVQISALFGFRTFDFRTLTVYLFRIRYLVGERERLFHKRFCLQEEGAGRGGPGPGGENDLKRRGTITQL